MKKIPYREPNCCGRFLAIQRPGGGAQDDVNIVFEVNSSIRITLDSEQPNEFSIAMLPSEAKRLYKKLKAELE